MKNTIARIFWGSLFIFFNINFYNLNYITTLFGSILLFTSMWQLRKQNRNLRTAFISIIIQLVIHTIVLANLCSPYSSDLNITITITFISSLNMLIFIYNLFSGLNKMTLINSEINNCNPFMCGFLYFIVIIASFIGLAAPPISIIFIPIVLIIFIYILYQAHKLDIAFSEQDGYLEEKRLNKNYIKILLSYILLSLIVCFVVVIFSNINIIPSEIYNKNDSNSKVDINKIKSKMLLVGFDKSILIDLPDSEIIKYQNIRSSHETILNQLSDGGKLKLVQYVSTLDEDKIRFLVYYKWVKPSKNKFNDVLGINIPYSEFAYPNDIDFNNVILYDRNESSGIVTYKSALIDKRVSNYNMFYPEMKFKLFNGDAINQRGFFAINFIASKPVEFAFNTDIKYYHQYNLLNIKYENALDFFGTQNNNLFSLQSNSPNTFVFNTYDFLTQVDYNP